MAAAAAWGGIQAPIAQNAKVVPSDISEARMMRRRTPGSANRSTRVMRASANSSAPSVSPLTLAFHRRLALRIGVLPALRFRDRTAYPKHHQGGQLADDEQRHASGPTAPTNRHAKDARKNPIPKPLCISPTPRPRARSGHSSDTIDVPITHSEPMATPTKKRRATNDTQSHANALRPVMIE
jgi:hypothetical protein